MENETYTKEEVTQMLVSVIMFANANEKQGVSQINGITYGDKANHIINTFDKFKNTGRSILSIVSNLRG